MSYQVLARKWRPAAFSDLVGQEHVLQALVQGLERNRLHHAYLFTGTRGVGKTTIGRILARCLNCESGVTATPCGTCGACQEIAQGRFVDLIEIDAASRTKVEDMRELLDNVQYSPTRGRFKIYLIDEVHMLSNSSFNALLKTLEEPPAHVKFLFATTDPQKLPVTILSRCLQFNLKQISPEVIVAYLRQVLAHEGFEFEDSALWLLARAADGSMRDALSLTDQAIAFCPGALQASQVSSMLGTIDKADVFRLLEPLLVADGAQLLAQIGRIADFAPDYSQVLTELLSVFHRISLEQCVPGSVGNALGDEAQICSLAARMSAEDTQLFYQIALMARKDLLISPDARMGFEMALLRMLAFRPGTGSGSTLPGGEQSSSADTAVDQQASVKTGSPTADSPIPDKSVPAKPAAMAPQPVPETAAQSEPEPDQGLQPSPESRDVAVTPQTEPPITAPDPATAVSPVHANPPEQSPGIAEAVPLEAYADALNSQSADDDDVRDDGGDDGGDDERDDEKEKPPGKPEPVSTTPVSPPVPAPVPVSEPTLEPDPEPRADAACPERSLRSDDWMSAFEALDLPGMAGNLAANAAAQWQGNHLTLLLDDNHFRLLNDRHRSKISEAVKAYWPSVTVDIASGEPGADTPAAFRERQVLARQQEAVAAIHQDPVVQRILQQFDGRLIEESIRPQ